MLYYWNTVDVFKIVFYWNTLEHWTRWNTEHTEQTEHTGTHWTRWNTVGLWTVLRMAPLPALLSYWLYQDSHSSSPEIMWVTAHLRVVNLCSPDICLPSSDNNLELRQSSSRKLLHLLKIVQLPVIHTVFPTFIQLYKKVT